MSWRATGATRRGARETNEDAFAAEGALIVVADGMGEHAAGERASRLAVDAIRAACAAGRRLPEAVAEAHAAVRRAAASHESWSGMGCAVAAAAVEGGRAVIAHAGDARAYLVRAGRAERLTRDHSVVAEMVERGHIPAEAARTHHLRHALTRSVGRREGEVAADVREVEVRPGDRLVLCTDGVWDALDDASIARIAESAGPEELVEAARAAGGRDDATAVMAVVE